MAVTKDQVLEFLKNMSVIELADFVKELEDVFGVSAAAPVAVAAAPAVGGAAPAAAYWTARPHPPSPLRTSAPSCRCEAWSR